MKISRIFFISIKQQFLALVLLIIIWHICSLFFESYVLPSPVLVFSQADKYMNEGFWRHFSISIFRLLVGFICSLFLGTLLGLVGFILNIRTYLTSLLLIVETIPALILGVIFLLVFGVGNGAPIGLLIFLTTPFLAINTVNALTEKNTALEEMLTCFGGTKFTAIRDLYLPGLIPISRTNINLGFSFAIKILILGEFLASQDGIGYLLNNARYYLKMDEVFFYLVLLITLLMVLQIIVDCLYLTAFRKYFYVE